jgi:hypothetical protein
VLHYIVILLDGFRADNRLDQRSSNSFRKSERNPGSEGKTDRRIDNAPKGAEDDAAGKARRLAGDRRKHHLQRLKSDEYTSRVSPVLLGELDQTRQVGKEVQPPVGIHEIHYRSKDQDEHRKVDDRFFIQFYHERKRVK